MFVICLVNPIAVFTQLTLLFLGQGVFIDDYLDRRDLPIYSILISAILYFVLYYFMERETSDHSTKQRASQILRIPSVRMQLRESLDSSLQASLINQGHTVNPNSLLRTLKLAPLNSLASSQQVSS